MKSALPPKPKILDACPVSGCRNPAEKGGLCRTCHDHTPIQMRRRIAAGKNKLCRWYAMRKAIKVVALRLHRRGQN